MLYPDTTNKQQWLVTAMLKHGRPYVTGPVTHIDTKWNRLFIDGGYESIITHSDGFDHDGTYIGNRVVDAMLDLKNDRIFLILNVERNREKNNYFIQVNGILNVDSVELFMVTKGTQYKHSFDD